MNRNARFKLPRWLCGVSFLMLSGSLLVPTVSFAESTPSADLGAAQAQYRKAYQAMLAKDWTGARRLLIELWDRSHTYDVAASLGQVEYHLKNYADGARYMAFALANIPPKEKPSTVERYRAALDELKSHVASVRVSVNAAEAEVRVDGRTGVFPSAPGGSSFVASDVFLAPGTHTFEARRAEERVGKTLDVGAGRTYNVVLALQSPHPDSVMAPAAAASTRPDSSPESAGVAQSTLALSAASGQPLATGPSAESGLLSRSVLPVVDLQPARNSWDSTSASTTSSRSFVPVYVGAGAAVAAGILAVGFGLTANSKKSDADSARTLVGGASACISRPASDADCIAAQDAYDAQRRNAQLANVAWGITAVAGAFTAGYWIWARSGRSAQGMPEPQGTTQPLIRPNASIERTGGTVWVTGSF